MFRNELKVTDFELFYRLISRETDYSIWTYSIPCICISDMRVKLETVLVFIYLLTNLRTATGAC